MTTKSAVRRVAQKNLTKKFKITFTRQFEVQVDAEDLQLAEKAARESMTRLSTAGTCTLLSIAPV